MNATPKFDQYTKNLVDSLMIDSSWTKERKFLEETENNRLRNRNDILDAFDSIRRGQGNLNQPGEPPNTGVSEDTEMGGVNLDNSQDLSLSP
jgi:hypothetical protein